MQLGYNNAAAKLVRTCLSHSSPRELAKAVEDLQADPVSSQDPENLYRNAEVLSVCGQGEAALRELRKAMSGNYCSYPALEKDPLFDPIRQTAEYAQTRQAAIQCQQNFLAHRAPKRLLMVDLGWPALIPDRGQPYSSTTVSISTTVRMLIFDEGLAPGRKRRRGDKGAGGGDAHIGRNLIVVHVKMSSAVMCKNVLDRPSLQRSNENCFATSSNSRNGCTIVLF